MGLAITNSIISYGCRDFILYFVFFILPIILVPLTVPFMNAPLLLNLINNLHYKEKGIYLYKIHPLSIEYEFILNTHKYLSTLWFNLSVCFLFTSSFSHKVFGYFYTLISFLSVLSGLLLLTYRPNINGEWVTELTLIFTAFYYFYSLYKLFYNNNKGHKLWSRRNILIPLFSVQNTLSITLLIAAGCTINSMYYRLVLCSTSLGGLLIIELFCG